MSSASWPPSQALGGVFDSVQSRNALAGANLAYVPYCTSDAYAGDAAASDDTFGWCAARASREPRSQLLTPGLHSPRDPQGVPWLARAARRALCAGD